MAGAPSVPVDRSDIFASFMLRLDESRYGRALPAQVWLKGRDASWLAVPPFLLLRTGEASLGCLLRGSHPLDPTCQMRLSSGDCLRARSLVVSPVRACTIPGSLTAPDQVLVSRIAGLWLWVCVRRLQPRRTVSRCPPERRAGVALIRFGWNQGTLRNRIEQFGPALRPTINWQSEW